VFVFVEDGILRLLDHEDVLI